MKGEFQNKKGLVRGKEVYIGVDVHKESWHVTVRAEEEEIFHGRIHSRYDVFQKLLDHFKDCRIKVAYEAGPCGFWLHDRLIEDGVEVIVAPPSLIPIESGNKVKTDKRDSRKLARLLEGNMLKRVYVVKEEDRVDRELLRTRGARLWSTVTTWPDRSRVSFCFMGSTLPFWPGMDGPRTIWNG